nr:uncharacterized mitochondrial protein AtMg00810-like [Tanacetum cinerariifolium]
MSSIGELTFFLGLQVKQKQDVIFINQDNYVAKILRMFSLTDGKSASTLIDTKKPLLKDPDGEDVNVHKYRSMICSLMYLTSLRPDIMFAVYACARFHVTSKASDLHAIKRIFRYLKGKPHLGLWYLKDSPFNLVAYSNSDYAVARIEAIRLFLAYASFMGFMVYQMDVKSAFLYVTIEEEVYVCPPPGFKDPDYPDKVYKVVKSLYGLHQAPRAWYETLATKIKALNKQESTSGTQSDNAPVYDSDRSAKVPKDENSVSSGSLITTLFLLLAALGAAVMVAAVMGAAAAVTTSAISLAVVTNSITSLSSAGPGSSSCILKTLSTCPNAARRRKRVVIRDPEETATPSTIVHSEPKSKDKGKGILVEKPKPLKKQAQIEQDEAYARELEAELNKNINWDDVIKQARKNMMVYLKNMVGFKIDFFKGMSYDDIKPIFKKHFNSVVGFLEKSEKELEEEASRTLKRKSKSSEPQAVKKQKLDEETYCCWYKLKLLDNAADSRLRLLEQSAAADDKMKK